MEILHRSGVRHLFGNPGTTELPFLDALPDSGLEYVVASWSATTYSRPESGSASRNGSSVVPGLPKRWRTPLRWRISMRRSEERRVGKEARHGGGGETCRGNQK